MERENYPNWRCAPSSIGLKTSILPIFAAVWTAFLAFAKRSFTVLHCIYAHYQLFTELWLCVCSVNLACTHRRSSPYLFQQCQMRRETRWTSAVELMRVKWHYSSPFPSEVKMYSCPCIRPCWVHATSSTPSRKKAPCLDTTSSRVSRALLGPPRPLIQ